MRAHPIFAALKHHRLATSLIVLQIALACAVMCNACSLIAGRWHDIQMVTGIDEASLGTLYLDGFESTHANDLNARVIEGLRKIPGVTSANVINTVPFSHGSGTVGVTLDPEGQREGGVVDVYLGTPGSLETLGIRLVEGRMPTPDEYRPVGEFFPSQANVLITRSAANHMWPGESPLGKEVYVDKTIFRVIGVMEHLAIARPFSVPGGNDWSIFAPSIAGPTLAGTYVIRAKPEDIDAVMHKVRDAAARIAPDAVVIREQSATLRELRDKRFVNDKAMIGILVGIILALLLVTALGIVGLASFWVARRRKQIGIRRAIGATRRDILHYFQLENFFIVTLGIGMGAILAYGASFTLMMYHEVPLLPPWYVGLGAVTLWVLGQLAVLGPALRAAAVPPVVATRAA